MHIVKFYYFSQNIWGSILEAERGAIWLGTGVFTGVEEEEIGNDNNIALFREYGVPWPRDYTRDVTGNEGGWDWPNSVVGLAFYSTNIEIGA